MLSVEQSRVAFPLLNGIPFKDSYCLRPHQSAYPSHRYFSWGLIFEFIGESVQKQPTDSFTACTYFQAENTLPSITHPPFLVWKMAFSHTQSTLNSEWGRILHAVRNRATVLNHIVIVFPTPSSVDIRWPCHFKFLSRSMMNEVSGTRCFLESSSRTAEANASIRRLQKWLCQSSVFSCYDF